MHKKKKKKKRKKYQKKKLIKETEVTSMVWDLL